jgi:hypothetical protein
VTARRQLARLATPGLGRAGPFHAAPPVHGRGGAAHGLEMGVFAAPDGPPHDPAPDPAHPRTGTGRP